jgi:hypothetical protein
VGTRAAAGGPPAQPRMHTAAGRTRRGHRAGEGGRCGSSEEPPGLRAAVRGHGRAPARTAERRAANASAALSVQARRRGVRAESSGDGRYVVHAAQPTRRAPPRRRNATSARGRASSLRARVRGAGREGRARARHAALCVAWPRPPAGRTNAATCLPTAARLCACPRPLSSCGCAATSFLSAGARAAAAATRPLSPAQQRAAAHAVRRLARSTPAARRGAARAHVESPSRRRRAGPSEVPQQRSKRNTLPRATFRDRLATLCRHARQPPEASSLAVPTRDTCAAARAAAALRHANGLHRFSAPPAPLRLRGVRLASTRTLPSAEPYPAQRARSHALLTTPRGGIIHQCLTSSLSSSTPQHHHASTQRATWRASEGPAGRQQRLRGAEQEAEEALQHRR